MSLGVAIVGAGIIGRHHAAAVMRQPELRLVAVVDQVEEAARALAAWIAEETGVTPSAHTSLEAALSARLSDPPSTTLSTSLSTPSSTPLSPPLEAALGGAGNTAAGNTAAIDTAAIDIVVICSPSGSHTPIAEEALAAGLHVVIEKPLDASLPAARRLAALAAEAEARGQVCSVISQHRFDPASAVVAEAVHGGTFGRITSAMASVAWWRSQDYYDSAGWRGTWAQDGGGATMNQGIHTVDLLVWLLGHPVEVSAYTGVLAHQRIEVEDVSVAVLRFASGALATVHATTAAYPGLSVRLQVHGDRGSAVIHDDTLEYFHAADCDDTPETLVPPSEVRGGERPTDSFLAGHVRQYDDIVDAITNRCPPGVRALDALLALAVVKSFYLSAHLGRPVAVDAVLGGDFDDALAEAEQRVGAAY